MLSRLLLGVVLAHWAVIGIAYIMQAHKLFGVVFAQASPVWLMLYATNPAVLNGGADVPLLFFFTILFCLFKYVTFLRAMIRERLNPFNIMVLVSEVGYILASGAYLSYHGYL